MKSTLKHVLIAAGLLATAGTSTALARDPVVDGKRDAEYGAALATQKSTVIDYEGAPRVNLTITSDVSNVGGKGEFLIAGTQSAPAESDPALVTRGVEVAIRLADLPGSGVGGIIKLAGFISGGTFVSNQVIGGLPGDPGNLGEPRAINLDTGFAGNQFVSISTAVRSPTAPTIDGIRGTSAAESTAYGARFAQTDVGTAFGSNSVAPTRTTANGSEIDGVYAYIYDNGTAGNPNDDVLCLFVAGNLEPNFNGLILFLDCIAGGQNTIARGNYNGDFNFLNRIGENADGTNPETPGTVGPGFTFDAAFTADYWIKIVHGGNSANSTVPPSPNPYRDLYVNSATLPNVGSLPGLGTFFQGTITTALTSPASGVLGGSAPNNPDAIRIDIDNTNSANVGATAPNHGGVGGRVSLPGGGSQADTTGPAGVKTGVEFKVNLAGIGYPGGAGSIRIAGIIVGTNYDYMSNQAIGGLTSVGTPDPNNLGFPAKDTDFNSWDGNQYVTVAVPGAPPAAPAGATVDGKLNTNAGEETAYGSPLWTNTTNASAFGNAKNVVTPPFTVTQDRANGSELDAIYAYVANDPANSNAPTLYVMVTGNLHDFNKLVLFFDTAAGGQNDIRGDNFGFENFNGGLGGPDGFTFDTGFEADYAVSYILGWDTDLAVARHFCDGTQLLTAGGGFGGRFGGGDKVGVGTPISGTIIARIGFGDNNLTPLGGGFDRSVNANGSELDGVYAKAVSDGFGGGTLHLFFAGNLEPNLTSLELFFDTIAGGQNTLAYDFRGSQDPAYTGNPDVDFGALNRMGGPVFDDQNVQIFPGMTFDTGFDADYYFSLRTGDFNSVTQVSTIFANWARLRKPADAAGPMPFPDSYRYIGNVPNDSLGGPPGFINGDLPEIVSAGAIDNANIGGVGGGKHFYCHTDPAETNPANVATGIEVAIDLADLGFGSFAIPPGPAFVPGVTEIKMMAFLNGSGHGKVANQLMQFGCTDDLGEPRNVNFQNVPGNQYIQFPTAVAAPAPCKLLGDANNDGFVNFADVTAVLVNFNGAGPTGDADGNGVVNFADITTILVSFNQGDGC